jgi:hypothetical protein
MAPAITVLPVADGPKLKEIMKTNAESGNKLVRFFSQL